MSTNRAINVLYLLNAAEGGASQGIYEFVPHLPRDKFRAFALVPKATAAQKTHLKTLFEEVRIFPLPWWNVRYEAGLLRQLAFRAAQFRRGIVPASVQAKVNKVIRDWHIDLVHTGTSLNRQGAIAAQKAGIPHIWHIKETIGSANRVHFPLPDPQLARYFESHSARVLAMSDYVAQFFRQHGLKNLEVIPDGVDLTPYEHNISRDLRASLNLGPNALLVGMVAGLSSTWKQHDRFIRMAGAVAGRSPEVHFVIVGGMPSPRSRFPNDLGARYAARIKALAAETLPPGRLTFVDHVPAPDDIMRSLDILVHPCDIEPFGRVALEAMAAGRPVVGPLTGGIAETVIDGETGILVDTADLEAFSGAVSRLINDTALRTRLGEAAVSHVSGSYNILLMVDRISTLYEQVIHH